MRIAVIGIVSLMIVALAAFGVVARQQASSSHVFLIQDAKRPGSEIPEANTLRPAPPSKRVTENSVIPVPSASAAPVSGIPACDKPGGMGLSRIVEIDTAGGPGFGFEHFKQYDFLHEKEVVLTFERVRGRRIPLLRSRRSQMIV